MVDIDRFVPPRIRALKAYSTEERHLYETLLDANEMAHPLPDTVRARIAEALADVDVGRYPDAEGRALRAKLADSFGVAADHLMLGNGSDDLLQIVTTAFSAPAGGRECARMFHFDPSFSMYRLIAEVAGTESVAVPLDDDYDLDMVAFEKAIIGGAPNVVFIGYPNNPTGKCFSRDKIVQILETSGALVVVDEAYGDYANDSFLEDIGRFDNLIVLRTFSKVGGAGIRLGLAAASPALLREMDKVRLPFNVNALSQRVATVLVDARRELDDAIAQVVRDRGRIEASLAAFEDVEVVPSDANFVLFRPKGRAEELFEGLKKRGILLRNVAGTGLLEDALRVTVGTAPETDAFLAAVHEILGEQGE